jgi:hypothetical protein
MIWVINPFTSDTNDRCQVSRKLSPCCELIQEPYEDMDDPTQWSVFQSRLLEPVIVLDKTAALMIVTQLCAQSFEPRRVMNCHMHCYWTLSHFSADVTTGQEIREISCRYFRAAGLSRGPVKRIGFIKETSLIFNIFRKRHHYGHHILLMSDYRKWPGTPMRVISISDLCSGRRAAFSLLPFCRPSDWTRPDLRLTTALQLLWLWCWM